MSLKVKKIKNIFVVSRQLKSWKRTRSNELRVPKRVFCLVQDTCWVQTLFLATGELRVRQEEVLGSLLDRGDGLVDGLSHVVDVLTRQTAHVDATAGHQVDVFLLHQIFDLLG